MAINSGPMAVFRFDAGPLIGGGHAMRCLALAKAMNNAGWWCHFALNARTIATVSQLSVLEPECLCLLDDGLNEPEQIADSLRGKRCEFLIVDHYGRGAEFETACRSFADTVFVVDDLAKQDHDADILLNQNLGSMACSYAGLVPENCRLLLGPDYALLRPDFAELRDGALIRRRACEKIDRVLVSFGMTDPCGLTLRALSALTEVNFAGYIDVVISSDSLHLAEVHGLATEMGSRVQVHCDVNDMAKIMADADLAIGAAGTTSWERCSLGLPALIVVAAENQAGIAEAIAKAGAAWVIGDAAISDAELQTAIADKITDKSSVVVGAKAAAAISDGTGCARVLKALTDG